MGETLVLHLNKTVKTCHEKDNFLLIEISGKQYKIVENENFII